MTAAVSKIQLYAGTSENPTLVLIFVLLSGNVELDTDNVLGADNQQGSPLAEMLRIPQRLYVGPPKIEYLGG